MNRNPFIRLLNWMHFSLRWKLALVFGVPILLVVMLVSVSNYYRTRTTLERQVQITAVQLSEVILGGLNHAMLNNDRAMLQATLTQMVQRSSILRVWVVDPQGVVSASSLEEELGQKFDTASLGCVECHQVGVESRPQVTALKNPGGTLRVVSPIDNQAACQACHAASQVHLGILLADTSLAGTQEQILSGQRMNLFLTLLVLLAGVLGTFEVVHLLVIRRIEVLQKALARFQQGDFSERIPVMWRTRDELTYLAENLNQMADALALQHKQQSERNQMRQQAILEERERIARELHDGVAQFLAYMNTKIIAARLLLKNQQYETVDKHLGQIEAAVQDQSLDVRASIVGLKLAGITENGLVGALRNYIRQCSPFVEFLIELEVEPSLEQLRLDPEKELHLVRIVQEALSNVRKHAGASSARISLMKEDQWLVLAIYDDGIGFNPWIWHAEQHNRFGLQTMRERAGMVGALFSIESEPGCGTTVLVKVRQEEA
jgi:signal transduction histidine kinase